MKTRIPLPQPALYIMPKRKKLQKEESLLDSESADNTANGDNPSAKNNTDMDLNSRKAGPPQGHKGILHYNRSEYTKRHDVHRCANGSNKHMFVLEQLGVATRQNKEERMQKA